MAEEYGYPFYARNARLESEKAELEMEKEELERRLGTTTRLELAPAVG